METAKPILITAAITDWLQYNKRHTERTQETYAAHIERFYDSLPSKVQYVQQIKASHLQDYINHLLNRGLMNASANRHLVALKSFCRWLSVQYDIPNESSKLRPLKEAPPNARFLTREEYRRVLSSVDGQTKIIIQFVANTGLRATEFINLNWGDISEDAKRMVITGKGRKRRTVPLNSICRKIISELREPDSKGPIFTKRILCRSREGFYTKNSNRKLTDLMHARTHKHAAESDTKAYRVFLLRVCNDAAETAGIERFGSHALRHYFATELLRLGTPISHVSKMLGHSSIRTTEQLYIHWIPTDFDGVTECLVGK